ncbi:MAG: GMC family oxidoreductase N-terminal domain-containing protein [Rhodobiaceae bacterium]|nr:GMC family oxidoreductase N-terminal domain-containing protein [Rhodobiaceae bacterium]MCC0056632.1 GMC family oxidoreductase N-terminal domain-containing protein [Rhodobiaceae bacterium]
MTLSEAQFDYVIVGGGAAGSVLAARLSEDPSCTVCLLEAGPEPSSINFIMPAGFTRTLNDERYTWGYFTEPSERFGERRVKLIQGKVLGGGTSVNGMIFTRGQGRDFDGWAQAGNPGWDYESVLAYFRKVESTGAGDDAVRGRSGAYSVNVLDVDMPVVKAFRQAAIGYGIAANADYNGRSQAGIGPAQVSVQSGRRVSAASAYLAPARGRRNLTVLAGVTVTGVEFDGMRARSVSCQRGGEVQTIHARAEIILAAGAIGTPKLLQLSGIGHHELLSRIGVATVRHLPGVGENFHDHYLARIAVRCPGAVTFNQRARFPRLPLEVLNWFLGRPSVVAVPPATLQYFLKTRPDLEDADVQGIFTPASVTQNAVSRAPDPFPGATCAVWQHRPQSRGFVRARSADPLELPAVQPNYLREAVDRDVLVAACRTVRAILDTEPFKAMWDLELAPGNDVQTDDEWIDYAFANGSTVFHPVGTAKMGPASDPLAVVDPTLRVHGVEGLRVVDASVMPQIASGNTAAATLMIAEKASDLIRSGARG